MKSARWYVILSLSFCLWLLLFPPWAESGRVFISDEVGDHVATVSHSLGHRWWSSVPTHWEWSERDQQSFLVPNLAARIDYQQMLYEAAIVFVALALLFLLLSFLEMPARIRNWRNRDLKGTMTGVRLFSPNPPLPPNLADALTGKPLGTPLGASEQVAPSPEGAEQAFDAKAIAAAIIALVPPRPVLSTPLYAGGWEEFRDARAAELRGQPPRPIPNASSTPATPLEVRK